RVESLRLVRVAVPVPLADTFDYLWPGPGPTPPPGTRVSVPFGRGERIGIVVEQPAASTLPTERLKSVRAALDAEPLIAPELFGTLLWAAANYHHPIGEVLTHALPGLLRRRERAAPRPATPHWRLTTAGRAALDDPA